MHQFWDQGLNSHHASDPNHSNNNTGCLTARIPEKSLSLSPCPAFFFLYFFGCTQASGSFQARDSILESQPQLQRTPQLQHCRILDPLCHSGNSQFPFRAKFPRVLSLLDVTSSCPSYSLSHCIKNASFFFFFCFLGPHPWHMEVPRLGVELELQLLAFATATAMPDPSHVCNLHHTAHGNARSLTC